MAASKSVQCTVALHEDRVSESNLLCGSRVLPRGHVARLSAKGARSIIITADKPSNNPDEISLHAILGQRFGFEHRNTATIHPISDAIKVTATHIEFFFREDHLSRADIWRLMKQLDRSVLYKGQEVSYLGSPVATVEGIFISGEHVESALVSHVQSKPIFRSGSARFTILIQISREMLEQWRHGYLMYEMLIDGFLTELFARWEAAKTRHQVRIVLFGRHHTPGNAKPLSGEDDFYQVVTTEASAMQRSVILRRLKTLFNGSVLPRQVSLAADGNMAEAFQLAVMDFLEENVDTRLNSTGSSIIAVTAGSGKFHADYDLLKRTTQMLMGNSIGVDLVSLAKRPLHPGPLFQYRQNGVEKYALPHWLDISYWHDGIDEPAGLSFPGMSALSQPLALKRLSPCLAEATADSATANMSTFDAQLFHGVREVSKRATFVSGGQPFHLSPVGSMKIPRIDKLKKGTLGGRLQPSDKASQPSSSLRMPPSPSSGDVHASSRTQKVAHPFLKTRTISLGPRGLAPNRGTASTTITSAHAGQEKQAPVTPRMESSAGLAKQIRASLRRKSSQQSLLSQTSPTSMQPTKPIDIATGSDIRFSDVESLTTLNEDRSGDMEREDESSTGSPVGTPKATNKLVRSTTSESITSAQQQMAPWVTLLNPSNLRRDNMRVASQYRKWQHVFPKAISSKDFKWLSICSPAVLPLTTEYRPSQAELDKDYRKRHHRILRASKQHNPQALHDLMDEMISLRLIRGFQIVIDRLNEDMTMLEPEIERALLAKGNRYHEIHRLDKDSVEVIDYDLKIEAFQEVSNEISLLYEPLVKPELGNRMKKAGLDVLPPPKYLDWDKIDQSMVNPEVGKGTAVISSMRLVLLPIDFSKHEPSHTRHKDLSDDERRIEGIQRLTQFWQRHQVFSTHEKVQHASLTRPKASRIPTNRDPNPLAIEYQTRDPSAVVQAHGPNLLRDIHTPLFAESEMYHSSNFDISRLIRHMQDPPPNGIEVKDRRWFTSIHLKCFRGDELTNWLLRVFKDLTYRDDAIALGKDLMKRGVFTHVRHKHDFEDGNYFYQIASAYRTTEYPDTSNLFGKVTGRSVPQTPVSESMRSPETRSSRGDTDSSKRSDSSAETEKKKLLLSQVMHYNVDERGTSKDQEVVNIHYDRIHNPENCYHIQLDWMEATAKLIRVSLNRWAALAEGHGLKLVQVPMAEASRLSQNHALDQPYLLKLSKPPPSRVLATPSLDAQSFAPRHAEDKFAYHKALLRACDFVLDFEAASEFESSVQVLYSWGKPKYSMTQFIHRSGLLLAQVVGDGTADFLLVPNRLAFTRTPAAAKQREPASLSEIVEAFTLFCHDSEALSTFYEEVNRPRLTVASPFSNSSSKQDFDVPPLQLPPHILQRMQTSG